MHLHILIYLNFVFENCHFRNYQSYLNCIAPYKDACIQNKHRLAKAGSESLSVVVDRMETLSKYVALLCVEHNQGRCQIQLIQEICSLSKTS